MTVDQLIQRYNAERPNAVDDALKIGWLESLEKMILQDVILTHEHGGHRRWPEEFMHRWHRHFVEGTTLHYGYPHPEIPDEVDLDTQLLVDEPYTDVYIYWLDQKIAINNNDMKRLNVASQAFNNAYLSYQQWYNRTHRPRRPRPHLLRHEVLD